MKKGRKCLIKVRTASKLVGRVCTDERTELKLIHQALFDPYDQSLWFYHQNLMCTFDPDQAVKGMAPNLSNEERLRYVAAEQEYIEEVLEDAEDCKWAYLALIESTLIESKLKGGLATKEESKMSEWVKQLHKLDPLRRGRWRDLEQRLKNNTV
jgi:geranylgeranyl transferase type-2 subunit alpha